ncbi:MAG TPA: XRE family transcriptional regulator [Streptosporangiaceae bacterium]|nr:XRE family transcriptional regulator [Streptosporangiaceae bacterium]
MNESLRRALDAAGLTAVDLASKTGVDPKTAYRWVGGRVPYARHRRVVATLLNADEKDLWPVIAHRPPNRRAEPASEVLNTYPHRWAVPRATWHAFFNQAETQIGILAYAALFLAEDAGIVRAIGDRAQNGVAIRILLGNPDGPRIRERGEEEGIGTSITAKIHNVLALLRPLLDIDGVELRFHDTVLYNSIYRSDEELLINPHVYGLPAAQAPTLHLHTHQDGSMARMYIESFERVWEIAEQKVY